MLLPGRRVIVALLSSARASAIDRLSSRKAPNVSAS